MSNDGAVVVTEGDEVVYRMSPYVARELGETLLARYPDDQGFSRDAHAMLVAADRLEPDDEGRDAR